MQSIDLKKILSSNDITQLKAAIESGLDVNVPIESVFPDQPLLYFCNNCHLKPEAGEMLQILIDAGADLSTTDKFDHNAMHLATLRGCGDIVGVLKRYDQAILVNCSLLDLMIHRPRHPMHDQRKGYKEVLRLLLEERPDLEEKTNDENPKTALHIACNNGFQVEIEMLLLAGASPNSKDSHGESPLAYIANYAWRAHIDCLFSIYYLLKCGADIDNLGNKKDSETALGWATMYGGNTLTVVTHLLESGANPNKENNSGETPLIHAARSERVDIVQTLLFFGANLNYKDSKDKTALDHAIETKRHEVIKVLTVYKDFPDYPLFSIKTE